MMKVVLCCAVFVTVLALSSAEECRDASQCTHVTCPDNNYQLECHYRQCTCTQVSGGSGGSTSCGAKTDCGGSHCTFGWHCIDSRCRCGFGFGGGN